MPRLKQPTTLRSNAFETLVDHTVAYCDRLSVAGDLTRLSETISVIKKLVRDCLSNIMFIEFYRQFLNDFYEVGERRSDDETHRYGRAGESSSDEETARHYLRNKRPNRHLRVALEMMMDVEIVGARCEGAILRSLDPRDANRILGLKILDLSGFWASRPKKLENFRLRNLTTFIYPRLSSDDDLEIIGSNCPNIQVLMIQESKLVTDRGLRALRSCPELRIINLHYCRVTDTGINEMLSVNEKLEEFNVGRYYTGGEESYEILSRDKSSVCPSIKRFSIKSNPVTNEHLNAVLTLFPNLTFLGIYCKLEGDIRSLKSLTELTEVDFSGSYAAVRMDPFKELLTNVGANLTFLGLHSCTPTLSLTQSDLNFIFEHCGNVESLEFCFEPTKKIDKLVVPAFRKLKQLECYALVDFTDSRVNLDFDEMSELEYTRLQRFDEIFKVIESMMLDHVKFPKLKVVQTFFNRNEETDRLTKIAKDNNIDFSVIFGQ